MSVKKMLQKCTKTHTDFKSAMWSGGVFEHFQTDKFVAASTFTDFLLSVVRVLSDDCIVA